VWVQTAKAYKNQSELVTEMPTAPHLVFERTSPGVLLARLSDNWRGQYVLPGLEVIGEALSDGAVKFLEFDVTSLTEWDSRLVAFVSKCADLCQERDVEFRAGGLPEGVRRLLRLAHTVPEKKDTHFVAPAPGLLEDLGEHALKDWDGALGHLKFLGENVLAFCNLLRGRAQFRWADSFLVMEQCGPQALGIVALINFLVGLILAFVGAVELQRFVATIYVADLVGIATVREMGCLMTGIILCGRTGAAFAAQLGTMRVNEEISALQTFGISPVEFLVLPRMVALMLMMPLLCVFGDLIGIAGGFFVSVATLGISPVDYITRTVHAIQLGGFLLGIGKSCVFGFLVAYTGCLRGMQSGYSAAAVGEATTRAVVAGITAIIASDGLFAVFCRAFQI
jgi:phospholipid/cholesterol/gamma-HCH transport system permease protein